MNNEIGINNEIKMSDKIIKNNEFNNTKNNESKMNVDEQKMNVDAQKIKVDEPKIKVDEQKIKVDKQKIKVNEIKMMTELNDTIEYKSMLDKIMKTVPIIGITGATGGGKSTLATCLAKNYGFIEFAFADSLKDVLFILTGINIDKLSRTDKENYRDKITGLTMRQYLIKVGTLFRNGIDESFWIRQVSKKIETTYEQSDGNMKGIIVSDFRFENEFKWLTKWTHSTLIVLFGNVPNNNPQQKNQYQLNKQIQSNNQPQQIKQSNKQTQLNKQAQPNSLNSDQGNLGSGISSSINIPKTIYSTNELTITIPEAIDTFFMSNTPINRPEEYECSIGIKYFSIVKPNNVIYFNLAFSFF